MGAQAKIRYPSRAVIDRAVTAARMAGLDVAGIELGPDGSVRVMGTAFATGQAAGVAAALQQHGPLTVEAVQRALRAQDALI